MLTAYRIEDSDLAPCHATSEYQHVIPENALDTLDADQRDALLNLLAEVSERSYRRGFQQGYRKCEMGTETRMPIHDWRFSVTYRLSPSLDMDKFGTTARDRLVMEYRGLIQYAIGGVL